MNSSDSLLQVRSKLWLEVDGEPVFGQGRDQLLRLIQQHGSINVAAQMMGVPYRKAWTYINAMETRLGFPLVHRLKGGTGGGKSSLTPQAELLLKKFDLLLEGFEEMVNRRFEEIVF